MEAIVEKREAPIDWSAANRTAKGGRFRTKPPRRFRAERSSFVAARRGER
jgi:hypothetical protein